MGKKRPQSNRKNDEFLYGINAVTEAIKARKRKLFCVFFARDKGKNRFSEIERLAGTHKIPVEKMKFPELSEMAGNDSHQGVVAHVSPFQYSELDAFVVDGGAGESAPFLVILDGLEDPQNLGALSRTALCAGAGGLIIPKDRSAAPTPSASKASAGALEHIPVCRVTNLVTTIKELKDKGYWIAGLDADADTLLYETDLTMPLAIVVGGEGRGLRPLVRKHCDYIVSIPQSGPVNSLNASVAGAVVMYEVVRQRLNSSLA